MMSDNKVPSDIVELIIAVDLDPTNPEEPINVTSVDKSEGMGKDQSPLCARLFKILAKMDPEMEAVTKSDLKDDEKISALEKLAHAQPEEVQDEADAFDKARDRKSERTPEERYGKPKPPKDDWKPRRDEGEDFEPRPKRPSFDDEEGFQPRKKSGGFSGARDRAFGKKPDFESSFKKDDEDEDEDEGGFRKKKEW
jgi:hypothetical protein